MTLLSPIIVGLNSFVKLLPTLIFCHSLFGCCAPKISTYSLFIFHIYSFPFSHVFVIQFILSASLLVIIITYQRQFQTRHVLPLIGRLSSFRPFSRVPDWSEFFTKFPTACARGLLEFFSSFPISRASSCAFL